jgi:AraC-like DNA-binding protein
MRIVLHIKSYNIADATDAIIRHIIRQKGNVLTMQQIAEELGVSYAYLSKRMEELNLKLRKQVKRDDLSLKEKFFKRFDEAEWNKNIIFSKSPIETVRKYVEKWKKERKLGRYSYFIFAKDGVVTLYLPEP